MDASAVVNGVLDGQAIPATGGLPIMDSRVLDQQPGSFEDAIID